MLSVSFYEASRENNNDGWKFFRSSDMKYKIFQNSILLLSFLDKKFVDISKLPGFRILGGVHYYFQLGL